MNPRSCSSRFILQMSILLLVFLVNPDQARSQYPLRIMPLGNSITYGNYNPETRPEGLITGYRQSLWLLLTEAGYRIDFVGSRRTGADAYPAFDPDNEGYPGWRDDQIRDNVYGWLTNNPPDVIILHIGTNGLDPNPSDVSGILDEIDRYETNYHHPIKVILAKIINRSTYSQLTTQFNQNIEKMAIDRVVNEGDDIVVIDMEFESAIDYRLTTSGGEMYDNLHPFVGGHEKMAVRWFDALREVLPAPDLKPRFTSCPNPYIRVESPYEYQAGSDGIPSPTFTLLDYPTGMAIDGTSGLLTWTPVTSGTFHITILAENSVGTDTQYIDIVVRDKDARINDGLLALYDFTESAGNLVHDISGVGSPLDLYINDENNIVWDPVQGLEITRESLLVPSKMNMKVIDSCMSTNEISLEAWIRTGSIEQGGPAHIFGITDPLGKGITLSQAYSYSDSAKYFYTRNLHTSTSAPDGSPALNSNMNFYAISLQHLVYTRKSDGTEYFYINGKEAGSGIRSGDFSAWNENTFKLSLCNSLGFKNAWIGKLFLAALYKRALSIDEVRKNYEAGSGNLTSEGLLPERPGNLHSTALSAVATRLTWEDSKDETGYVIERKIEGGSFHQIASVRADVIDYVDAGLKSGTSYYYRIKALNDFGESLHSNETIVQTFSDAMLYNLSRNKSASQSSTVFGGFASLGVDGITDGAYGNGSVTHTSYELNAWWEVDLGKVYNINFIEVWNRTDMCCKDRMARFNVFVSEEPFKSKDFQTTLQQPGVWSVYEDRYPEPMATFNVAKRGRYIRLQLSDSQEICLAEMVVMGSNHLGSPEFITDPVTEAIQDQEYKYVFEGNDPDDDSLVYILLKKPAWLHFSPVTKTLTGIPVNADTGDHQVTIAVYDGLYQVEQSYNLHVQNINDPPVFTSEPVLSTDQGSQYSYVIDVTDPDNDSLIFTVTSTPSWLNFDSGLHKLTGKPGQKDVGVHLISVQVSDGIVHITQEFQLSVIDVNDLPEVLSIPILSVNEDESYNYIMTARDVDGDSLTFTAVVLPDWLTFYDSLLIFSGTPDNEQVGIHNVGISISDGKGTIYYQFQISVVNVNDLPEVISSPSLSVNEDESYIYKIVARDADDDSLTYSAVQLPYWLTFDATQLILSGIPLNEQVGTHQVEIRVSDGKSEYNQLFQIIVINVNDLPEVLSIPPVTVYEDEAYSYTMHAIDFDGDSLEYAPVLLPEWLTFDDSMIFMHGIPGNEEVGIHDVALRISDGQSQTVHQFQIRVINVNDLPEITSQPPPSEIRPDQPYEYQITAYDMDAGDVLTFTSGDLPGWLNLAPGSGTALLSGTPSLFDLGNYTIRIMVSDAIDEVTQEFSILVLDPTGISAGEKLVERVYPIPVDKHVYFEFNMKGDILLKLYDIKGIVLKEVHCDSELIKVDLSDLPGNQFIYRVEINNRINVGKLIKK